MAEILTPGPPTEAEKADMQKQLKLQALELQLEAKDEKGKFSLAAMVGAIGNKVLGLAIQHERSQAWRLKKFQEIDARLSEIEAQLEDGSARRPDVKLVR